MIFQTESGSIYEINNEAKQIRRLANTNNTLPTDRQGKDEEWKNYYELFPNPIMVGSGVVIVWSKDLVKATTTSAIVKIIEDGAPLS